MTVDIAQNGQRAGSALAVVNPMDIVLDDAFADAYPALDPMTDMDELIEGALGEGATIRLGDLTRIKVPSGEIDDLQVPNPETGRNKGVEMLEIIPVGTASRRSYWESSEPNGSAPDCYSRDMVNGLGIFAEGSAGNPTGKCADCPMSKFGSATKGAGTACKEQRLLFFLTEGEILPMLLIIPPTSLKSFRDFGMVLVKRRVRGAVKAIDPATGRPKLHSPWFGLKVKITLEKDRNEAGQDFNRLKFTMGEQLDDQAKAAVGLYASFVEGLIAAQADQLDSAAGNAVGGDNPGAGAAVVGEGDGDFDAEGMPLDDGVDVPAASTKGKSAKS